MKLQIQVDQRVVHAPHPMNALQQQDCQEDMYYFQQLFNLLEKALQLRQQELTEYESYCVSRNLLLDLPGWHAAKNACNQLQQQLHSMDFETPLFMQDVVHYNNAITALVQQYRTCLSLYAQTFTPMQWMSAAYDQTTNAMFSAVRDQDSSTVNYSRYQSYYLSNLEHRMLGVLGFNQSTTNVLMTTSGMSAYLLIEQYIIRHVLHPGDTIYIPRYIYFEAEEQLQNLPYTVVKENIHTVDEVMAGMQQHQPAVLMLDCLTNNVGARLMNINQVHARLLAEYDKDVVLIVDATMQLEHLPSMLKGKYGQNVMVLLYSSASKYLQLGFDTTVAGYVAVPKNLTNQFERLRRNTGTILCETSVHLFPQYTKQLFDWRMKRLSRNAQLIVERIASSVSMKQVIDVRFPQMANHPDFNASKYYDQVGGLVTFRFVDPEKNTLPLLEECIALILQAAKRRGVSLIKGVSFGFSVPRISASLAMAATESPFLRLSVGDRSYKSTLLLADSIAEALEQFCFHF